MSDSVKSLGSYQYGIPSTQAEGAPRVNDQINSNPNPNAFGFANAQASKNLSNDLAQSANTFQNIADRQMALYNKTASDDAFNQFQTQIDNLTFGDPSNPGQKGLYQLRGKEALDAGPGAVQQIQKLRESIAAGMHNDVQRLAFNEASRHLMSATSRQIASHLDQQQQAWSDEVQKSALDSKSRSAGLQYNDDETLLHNMADANNIGKAAFKSKYGTDEGPEADAAGQAAQGVIVHSAIQGAIAQGDWTRAQAIFDKFGAVLPPNIAASLGQEVHKKVKAAGNDDYLDRLLGGTGANVGNSGLNGQNRPNNRAHLQGDLNVADQPSGQIIEPAAVQRATAIRDGLIKRGLDPETATAFAANALHESSANPNTGAGDMGASHGAFQWRDERAANLAKFTGKLDGSSLDQQLDFLVKELHGDESAAWAAIQSAHGVAAKASAISKYYERPKDTNGEQARRSATALQLAQQTGLKVAGGASTGSPADTGATSPGGSQQAPGGPQAPSQPHTPDGTPVQTVSTQQPAQPEQPKKDQAPADAFPDEEAATLQILRDTRGDPEQREALLAGLRQRLSIYKMATETDRTNLMKSLPNIQAALEDGKEDTVIPEAQIRHLLPPADAAAKLEELQASQQAGQAFKAIAWGTNEDIMAARARLVDGMGAGSQAGKKGAATGGVVPEGEKQEDQGSAAYKLRQAVLQKFDAKVAARDAALKADPASFVQGAPSVIAAAAAVDPHKPETMGAYFNAVSAVQTHLGIPESQQHLLTLKQAQAQAEKISKADPSTTDVGQQIDQMGKIYGDNWSKVYGDIVNMGKLPEAYKTLAMIGDPSVRNDFQRMLATAQEKGGTSKLREAISPDAKRDIEQNLDAQLDAFKKTAMVPGVVSNVDMVLNMKQSISDLAMFYTLQGQDGATAVRNAANGILGRYDFLGTWRVPKGTGGLVQAATENAIANLKPENLAPPPGSFHLRADVDTGRYDRDNSGDFKQKQGDMLALVRNKAVWVNNESDNGLVLFTQTRDGHMISVRNLDGSRVEVPFNSLYTQASQSGGNIRALSPEAMRTPANINNPAFGQVALP